MTWLSLCDGDPLVKTLSEVFRANIIRVPEERMQPLSTIAAKDDKLVYRGRLADLLAGAPLAEIVSPALTTGAMADVQGKRSRKIDVNLGMEIMTGFLTGFAGAASLGVAEHFSGALEISFSFNEVGRLYIDPAKLGRLLAGQKLDLQNGVVASFLDDDPWDCLVIDSIITSRDFTIRVERQSGGEFKFDLPAIESVLAKAKANVAVSNSSSKALTFKGPKALAFAFTCQPLILDQNGVIQQLPPDCSDRSLPIRRPMHGISNCAARSAGCASKSRARRRFTACIGKLSRTRTYPERLLSTHCCCVGGVPNRRFLRRRRKPRRCDC